MHIEIWTIGKGVSDNLHNALEDYTQRIQKFIKIDWVFLKNYVHNDKAIVLKKEAEAMHFKMQTTDYIIVLDRAMGKNISSEQLADVLGKSIDKTHIKRIIFIIGGAFGIDISVIKKAHFVLSFSALTLPHQLVRLTLAEQIYRSLTILHRIPYHH